MEKSKDKAADKIAKKKNKKLEPNEIDLHGLKVEAAEKLVKDRYAELKKKGKYSEMTIITGAGNHSAPGGPKIKSAIEKWAKQEKIKLKPTTEGSFSLKLK